MEAGGGKFEVQQRLTIRARWDMTRKTRKKKNKRRRGMSTQTKKLNLKRSVKKIGKLILKHLVEEPEKERERTLAQLARAVAKKFKRLQKRK